MPSRDKVSAFIENCTFCINNMKTATRNGSPKTESPFDRIKRQEDAVVEEALEPLPPVENPLCEQRGFRR